MDWDGNSFIQPWSHNGKPHTIEYLAGQLKEMIKKERKLKVPNEPPIQTPARRKLPVFGNQTTIVQKLDEGNIKDKEEFKENAQNLWKERES